MIINKKMLERVVRKDKYLFSYHNTNRWVAYSLELPSIKKGGYETTRYI